MRISDRMLFNSIVDQMQRQTESLFKLQEQVSTGKQVNRPSDDPTGETQILSYQNAIGGADQYLRNINQADSYLTASESPLQSVQDQLIRAKELAIQMANATYSATDRADAAKEVRQIYDQLIALGNTAYNGQYVFAGEKVSTLPFVRQGGYIGTAVVLPATITAGVNDGLTISVDGVSTTLTLPAGANATGAQLAGMVQTAINGDPTFVSAGISVTASFDTNTNNLVVTSNAVGGTSAVVPTGGTALATLGLAAGTSRPAGTYLGDSAEISVQMNSNATVVKNIPGDRLFKGVPGGTDLFAAVGGLQLALETNNMVGIQASLTALGSAGDQISNEEALLGARLNRTEATASMVNDLKQTLTKLKSEREDVDITRAISELSVQQTALQTTRAAAAKIIQQSLLDFLR